MTGPRVNILYTPGTNSHKETAAAFRRVGAQPDVVMMSQIISGERRLDDADLLCIPGGFAYGDHLGAGAMAGQLLRRRVDDQLKSACTKPVIAICNGFQIAVRAGLFGSDVALTVNAGGTFLNDMHQRHIVADDVDSVWLHGMGGRTLRFPCAHGEGRFVYNSSSTGRAWRTALRYPSDANPDGSMDDIAGISSPDGLVLGLMDHPERALDQPGTMDIFANGVQAAR